MAETIGGWMEVMPYYWTFPDPPYAYMLVTTSRFIIITPEELITKLGKKSGRTAIKDELKDIGISVGGDLIAHGFGIGLSDTAKQFREQKRVHGIMDKIRPRLSEVFDESDLQAVLKTAKRAFEIPYDSVNEVKMNKKCKFLVGDLANIEIIANLKGKIKKFNHMIIPPIEGEVNTRKRPVTDEEFSKYVGLIKSMVQEKLDVSG